MTQLQPARCKPAEFQRAIFAVTPEVGTPIEALLEPKYWAHVSMHFRPGCHIEVYPPDGSYYAELLVQDCGSLWAKVALIHRIELTAVEVGKEQLDLSGFAVSYAGVNDNFSVYRLMGKGKKDCLKSGFGTKEEAEAWLKQHVKTISGSRSVAA